MTITGNSERDSMLLEAIAKCMADGKPLSLDAVRGYLPADFDLISKELAAARRATGPQPMVTELPNGAPLPPETEPLPETLENFATPHAAEAEPPHNPPADAAPEAEITQQQARRMVEAAHQRLAEARVAVIHARSVVADCKGKLAASIEAWQTGGDGGLTAEQRRQREIRAHLAGELSRRQALKDAGLRPTKMRTDKHLAPGQSHFRGNHRGALPSSYQHRNVNDSGMFQGVSGKVKA